LEKIFTKTKSEDGFADVVRISPELNENKLDDLIAQTRQIIVSMYLSCEQDFKEALKIFDAIIDKQILEESVSIKEQLAETMNEYIGEDLPDMQERMSGLVTDPGASAL